MKIALAFYSVALAFSAAAQTPKDVLKVGTTLTFERVNKVGSSGQPSGESWTYTHEVTDVGEEVTVIEIGRSGRPQSIKPMRQIQFPLSNGKTWKHEFESQRMSPSGQPYTYLFQGEAKVIGEEDIVAGGNSVKAYRIEFSGWVNSQAAGQSRSWQYARTDWYAPTLGYVVQSDYKEIDGRPIVHTTHRLVKVETGK